MVMMAAMSLPLFAIWFVKKCLPSQRLLLVSLIPVVVSIGVVFFPQIVPAIAAVCVLLGCIAIFDIFTLVGQRDFMVEREVLKISSLGKRHEVLLTVANKSRWSCDTEIRDDVPNEFVADIEGFSHRFRSTKQIVFRVRIYSQTPWPVQHELRLHQSK